LTFLLDGGAEVVTVEAFEADEDPHDLIEEAVEDRESPWKTFGDLTLHFKWIKGWRAEEYTVASATTPLHAV